MRRQLWPYARKQAWIILGACLALVAEIGLRLLEPWPLKIVFDYVLLPNARTTAVSLPWIGPVGRMELLVAAGLAIVLVIGARALASFVQTIAFALAGNRACSVMRDDLFRRLQALPLAYHTRQRTGDLLLRVIGDAGMLRDIIVTAAVPLLTNILLFVCMVAVMFWLRWDLALLAVLPAPLFFLSTVRLTNKISDVSRRQRQREGTLASGAAEAIGAIRTVQALSIEDAFARAFHDEGDKSLRDGVKAKRLAAGLERTTDLLIALSTALVVFYGAVLALRGQITPGDLIVFLAYLKSAFKPLQDFVKYTGRMAKAGAAADRIVDVLAAEPAIRDLPTARPAPSFRGRIQFDRVSFAYDDGAKVLDELDFVIEPGENVAIVGESGVGKSTIAALVLRLYDTTSGRVLIDGGDVRGYTLRSLRSQIAAVLQDSPLFAMSIRDNILIGTSARTERDVIAAATIAGARDFIDAMPDGFATVVGERGATLSQGQRQRIAIARAVLRDAPILMLDEPTTGLDEENHRAVVEALERVGRERTVLLVTHDLTLAARADRVLSIAGGRLIESGTPAQLISGGGRYASLYRLQAGRALRP